MSAELQPFDFHGQPVRVLTDEQGDPWWFAADVAAVLGMGNVHSSLALLDEDERSLHTVESRPAVSIISESGLYSLVLRSRRPEAKEFKRWVTREVLPAIRRTGAYVAPMSDRDRAVALAREVLSLAEQVAELEPRAQFADRMLTADGDLSVADAGKALTRAGVKVGERRLFSVLAGMRWVYRSQADGRWRVYQAAIESGWMSVLPQSHYHPKTGVLVLDPPQPRVTPKGLQRLLVDHGVEQAKAIEAARQLAVTA